MYFLNAARENKKPTRSTGLVVRRAGGCYVIIYLYNITKHIRAVEDAAARKSRGCAEPSQAMHRAVDFAAYALALVKKKNSYVKNPYF